jgi:Lrp/AsnC family leucine-responsive transcriptional regulator
MPRDGRLPSLDALDCSIIQALQERGRDSFATIGKSIGLSATSVAERVRRLEQAGVIQGYQPSISTTKVGLGLTAFILARPIGPDERFAKRAAERPEIVECHRVTGDVSFIARAVVTDVKHLEAVLDHLESSCSYVVTLLVLSTAFERPVRVVSEVAGWRDARRGLGTESASGTLRH